MHELRIPVPDFFEQSYNELRFAGDLPKSRNWVRNCLTPENGDPITPDAFGSNPGELTLNPGTGKKFSGLVVSIIDYYEQNGIEEFANDKKAYLVFLQNAYTFHEQLFAKCEDYNYKSLGIAHIAEHAADIADVIAGHVIELNSEKVLFWHTLSLQMREKAQKEYQTGGHRELRVHQLLLNKTKSTFALAQHLISINCQRDEPLSSLESNLVLESACYALEVFNYQGQKKNEINASLVDLNNGVDMGEEIYHNKNYFFTKILIAALIDWEDRRGKLLSDRKHKNINMIDSDDFGRALALSSSLHVVKFLISRADVYVLRDMYKRNRDYYNTFFEYWDKTKDTSESEADFLKKTGEKAKWSLKKSDFIKLVKNDLNNNPYFKQLREELVKSLPIAHNTSSSSITPLLIPIGENNMRAMTSYTGLLT